MKTFKILYVISNLKGEQAFMQIRLINDSLRRGKYL